MRSLGGTDRNPHPWDRDSIVPLVNFGQAIVMLEEGEGNKLHTPVQAPPTDMGEPKGKLPPTQKRKILWAGTGGVSSSMFLPLLFITFPSPGKYGRASTVLRYDRWCRSTDGRIGNGI
ncbi:hypothetical protein BDK51DRAFT_26348 [Blyttiomyces helicus]|uniref:Uncharacterized protein n=1 Tax=Blyttiomyces helicus TaxID=388810 RepID=A0A4P9VYE6_9FUNG|nr:hypothetical protein BDK51DRAFT_26348 [Blyttiomyces helicus]|eukprot:RKO83975.1 hypothetical protein BDK51DRAFT_26348 [Blyttiomyces helicus]